MHKNVVVSVPYRGFIILNEIKEFYRIGEPAEFPSPIGALLF